MSQAARALSDLPAAYTALVARGATDPRRPEYLWVHEAEWIPPDRFGDPDWFYTPPISNLLPFAFTGAHDLWCWRLDVPTAQREFEILLCPRDCELADVFAPTFLTWLFRLAVQVSSGLWDGEGQTRENLRAWASILRAGGRADLADVVDEIASRPLIHGKDARGKLDIESLITEPQHKQFVRRWVGEQYWKRSIKWMVD